jgi:hypothetical protein
MATDILERLAIAPDGRVVNRKLSCFAAGTSIVSRSLLTRTLKGHYFGVPDAGRRAHLASAIDWA